MKLLPQAAVDMLDGAAPVVAGAFRLALPSGVQRVWSGYGEVTIEDEVYQGVGARVLVCPIASQVGGQADGLVITLSSLDPDIAKTIQLEDYKQKPVVIWRLIFAADAKTLLGASVFMRGKLDYVVVRESVGGEAALDFIVEGPRRDMNRAGGRVRSDSDQRLLGGAGDAAFKHVSTAGAKTLAWGQRPDRPFSNQREDASPRPHGDRVH